MIESWHFKSKYEYSISECGAYTRCVWMFGCAYGRVKRGYLNYTHLLYLIQLKTTTTTPRHDGFTKNKKESKQQQQQTNEKYTDRQTVRQTDRLSDRQTDSFNSPQNLYLDLQ